MTTDAFKDFATLWWVHEPDMIAFLDSFIADFEASLALLARDQSVRVDIKSSPACQQVFGALRCASALLNAIYPGLLQHGFSADVNPSWAEGYLSRMLTFTQTMSATRVPIDAWVTDANAIIALLTAGTRSTSLSTVQRLFAMVEFQMQHVQMYHGIEAYLSFTHQVSFHSIILDRALIVSR
jgi:hypothetical protein